MLPSVELGFYVLAILSLIGSEIGLALLITGVLRPGT